MAKKYDEAVEKIQSLKPCFLITEYEIDGKSGLALIVAQQKVVEDSLRLSIVVTKNSNDSVVAEAAEEQVDAFLLKPFSPNDFTSKMKAAIHKKTNPSDYEKLIIHAKRYLGEANFTLASDFLAKAKELNPNPALAHFYLGEIKRRQHKLQEALIEYDLGRSFQPLHYKCVASQFEVFVQLKKYEEATDLVAMIIKNFPISPRLLSSMFLCSTLAKNFESLNNLYDVFLKTEQRTEKLMAISSLAFMIAGTIYLSKGQEKDAISYFEKNLMISQRKFSNIEQIVLNFIKVKSFENAEIFLLKTAFEERLTPAFKQLSFAVDCGKLPSHKVIEAGKKLIEDGEANYSVFVAVVKLLVQENRMTLAESIVVRALNVFPEARESFNALLSTVNKAS